MPIAAIAVAPSRSSAPTASTDPTRSVVTTGVNTPNTSIASTAPIRGIASGRSGGVSGTVTSGTGGDPFGGSSRRDPDQWRKQ